MPHYLEFDTFDNPMHLSKVGNWVITFVSPPDVLEDIELAITHVMPRHLSDQLQPRRVLITQTSDQQRWRIQSIECYDSNQSREVVLSAEDAFAQTALHDIVQEFQRYDVEVSLI